MPIPPYEGRRTYFFFADVEPKELMTFGVESGIQLDDDSTLEVLGHALAYWAIAEEQDVLTLRAFVQDVFDVTLAIYALVRLGRGDRREALRLRAELHSWLEVRGVEARANVSLLHLAGMPWARIGELVGHDDLMTTARTYTHVVASEGELDYATLTGRSEG